MATLIQMLEKVLASKDALLANETRRILLKEALQAFVLDFLYNHRIYRALNFYGGSCLRVVYGLNRLSEDLDLDNQQGIGLDQLPEELLEFVRLGLETREATCKTQRSRQGILRITLRFPVLQRLGLSSLQDEALHLKLEISHHQQAAVIRRTPLIFYGRSFVPSHYSLETMMAAKMLACLERSFQKGRTATLIKGRDFYDLLWFMQKRVNPLEEKLARDGDTPYTIRTAFQALSEKVALIQPRDLAVDLLALFEQRSFIEGWIEAFHENFEAWVRHYLD